MRSRSSRISAALALSLVTVAFGVVALSACSTGCASDGGLLEAIGWGPDRGFDQAISRHRQLSVSP
jgi:multicomponent Na+:H+ antiporter subunit A